MTDILNGDPRVLRNGGRQVISYPGMSQYQLGGLSACGLASLNCARVLFEREASGLSGRELIDDLLGRATTEEILSICTKWSSSSHIEIEDVIKTVPMFNRSMILASTTVGVPSARHFSNLLTELLGTSTLDNKCGAVVITRPPEIIVCLTIPIDGDDIFVVFDSHTRPSHPNGAGFSVFGRIYDAAKYLQEMFPVDSSLLAEDDIGWQSLSLTQYCGHFLVPRRRPEDAERELKNAVQDSSDVILDLKGQVEDLKRQNESLESNNQRLEREILQAIDRYDVRGRRFVHPVDKAKGKQKAADNSSSSASYKSHKDLDGGEDDLPRTNSLFSQFLGMLSWSGGRGTGQQRSRSSSFSSITSSFSHVVSSPIQIQSTFHCAVCLEDHHEEDITRLDCGHDFCRDSLRNHVTAKLKERIYPIRCPVCSADRDVSDPGVVDPVAIQIIGLAPEDYLVLEELELSGVCFPVQCRGCQQTFLVDRQDYSDQSILLCPLVGCSHRWCKDCNQEVEFGSAHSCDGTKELDNLMKDRGWKYCPGCKTPIQKTDGCNHMTCRAPGCNTEFCYVCAITKSTTRSEVEAALERHYKQCRLFEDVDDRDVPP